MQPRRTPLLLPAYLRLMRVDRPVGIWLLMWPCWWSATLAAEAIPWATLLLFALGAAVMRSAGCIINDLADRDIDPQVARTASRPLASGEVRPKEAFTLLGFLLVIAAIIALMLGPTVLALSALWLIPVALYPFAKRITWWPQLFLGLTFNAGAILGWVAITGSIGLPAGLLYLGAVGWTLGYDTLYAHQDRQDDARIGMKSTALRLGGHTKPWVFAFYGIFVLMLVAVGGLLAFSSAYYIMVGIVALHLGLQVRRVDLNQPERCLAAFRANQWTGLLIWLACVLGGTPVPLGG